jgi:hypothetical protein
MTVVRELVTKLGFQVDQRGVEQFNRTIIGFKTKFAIAATAAAAFVAKTLDFFKDISDATLDADDLAKSIGISFEEFIKLRRVAEDFRIEPKNFQAALINLSKLLREARNGMGELGTIAYYTGIEFRDKFTGEVKNARDLFVDILKKINEVQTETERFAIAKLFFGEEDAQKFIKFAKEAGDNLDVLTVKYDEYAKSLKDSLPALEEVNKSIRNFWQTFEGLKIAFVEDILPAITFGVKTLEVALKGIGYLARGIKGAFKIIGQDIQREYMSDFLEIPDFEVETNQKINRVMKNQSAKNAPTKTEQNINLNTRIEMQVPPGTTDQQQNILRETVEEVIKGALLDEVREIYNNNPQVE